MFYLNLTRVEIGLMLVMLSILISFLLIGFWVKHLIRAAGPARPETEGPRSRRVASGAMAKLNDLLHESESISRRLTHNLEEKKEITHRLIKGLDERIKAMDQKLNPGEPRMKPSSPPLPEKDVYAKALEMSNAGVDPGEISRLLHLPKGEAQLIHDLRRYSR